MDMIRHSNIEIEIDIPVALKPLERLIQKLDILSFGENLLLLITTGSNKVECVLL